MRRFRSLDGAAWSLRLGSPTSEVPLHFRGVLAGSVSARVPGCVHTDLMSANILQDPNCEDHELQQTWVGASDWIYERTFDVAEADLADGCVDLVFDGLDTVAAIEVNGELIAESKNMHVPVRCDLRGRLRSGENTLRVRLASPRRVTDEAHRRDPLPHVGGVPEGFHPHNQLRKMACNFGWDWGPDVATSGIWRPVRLEWWSEARIQAVRPLVVEATERRAVVRAHVDLERDRHADINQVRVDAVLTDPDGKSQSWTGRAGAVIEFVIPEARRWWPRGHGAQPLYSLRVSLKDARGELLDEWQKRIGLKTSRLCIERDATRHPVLNASGSSFTLWINDKPIYLKGANWIPADCFPHRLTRDRLRHLLTLACDANFNIVRVWGGGLYESEEFYDACDEMGLLVWQDFLFACSMYPEHEAYRQEVEREARHAVSRLANHASLAIYNGGNECIEAGLTWGEGFPAYRASGKPWGLHYWHELLPRVLRELDPTRPYWPNSPYSGSMDVSPNANEHGNRHIWDVWNGTGTYRNYLGHFPRMATEFGYHGPPCYATFEGVIPPKQRYWNSPLMLLHNKNQRDGQLQTNERMGDDFIQPIRDYDRWHYLAQVMQARALTMGVEWFRALHPWNAGAIFWQFNDCYPVSSWSATDSAGRAKPLLHAARRFFAPRLLTIRPVTVTPQGAKIGALAIYLHNDTDDAWKTSVTLRLLDLECRLIETWEHAISVDARSNGYLPLPERFARDGNVFLHVRAVTGEQNTWWFGPDKQLAYPKARFHAELIASKDGYELTIHAQSLLRDVVIQVDRLDPEATINDACVTVLAGESHRFRILSEASLNADQLLAFPVFQCANGFTS